MSRSEILKMAQHNLLIYCPVDTEERRNILLDMLFVLMQAEREEHNG